MIGAVCERSRLPVWLFVLVIGAGGSRVGAGPAVPDALRAPSPDGLPRRLILALDGVPFELFDDLQRRGWFREFGPARRMVATFPSLTDVSFSAIAGAEPPAGYQVVRFDRTRNRVVGSSLRSLSGSAHRWVPADTRPRTVLNRLIGYVRPYRTAVRQLHRMREDFLRSEKETFVAYIEATDSVLHIQGREPAERFLIELDSVLDDLALQVRRRAGRGLAVDIVSDHGSTLERGRPVRLRRALAECGFRRSHRLRSPADVAYTQAGIVGSVALSCDPERAENVARCVLTDPAVDFAAFSRGEAVVVVSRRGEAEIRLRRDARERYAYRIVSGDPLGLATLPGGSGPGGELVLDEREVFQATLSRQYPDPLRRLWRAFHGTVQQPSEVLLSLRDGFQSGSSVVRLLSSIRGNAGTHGSLTQAASLGLLASNWRDLVDADAWTTRELLFGPEAFAAQAELRASDRRRRGTPPPATW
jgi:hypothetical protein